MRSSTHGSSAQSRRLVNQKFVSTTPPHNLAQFEHPFCTPINLIKGNFQPPQHPPNLYLMSNVITVMV